MGIFKKIETYLYSAGASAVMVWTAHHPQFHDLAVWLLGVIGTAIGMGHTPDGQNATPAGP